MHLIKLKRPEQINVKRSNKMLGMLFDDWKDYTNEGRPLSIKWNIMHMYSSCQLAKLYAIKHNLDIDLCALIAILHDIAVVDGKFREDHDRLATPYVENAIYKFNNKYQERGLFINPDDSRIIIEAITVHSSKEVYSNKPYVEMLKDIDSLDRYLYGIETSGPYATRVQKQLDFE